MAVDGEIRQLILDRVSSDIIRQRSVQKGMQVLRECGWQKVKEGITTVEEVIRVAQDVF
jgi:type II secretory ATPase GspE/PulE/Tfp pilus assembly ATPase PilB-like protein